MKHTVPALTGALLLALASCSAPSGEPDTTGETDGDAAETGPEASGEAGPATPSAAADLQLIKLDCGTIYVSDLDIFSTAGDYAGQTDTFTDTCWLVRHPAGDLLWDLGLPGILTSQGEQTTGVFTVSLEETIADQLDAIGLGTGDIDYVSLSHSHFDHTGQVDLLDAGETVWLVNQLEYDYMFPAPEIDEDMPAEDDEAIVDDSAASTQFPGFEILQHEIIADDHDVFGDGSVIIFMTPGHTPGHASLEVNLPETGPVLLTGDVYHRKESRDLKRVPQFNSSEEETVQSIEAFEDRADELGALIIIQHEPADTEGLPAVMK